MVYSHLPPNAPSPRICIVRKKEEHMEYGFNLHAERGKGQFVGAVDAGSPAEFAGLRLGDRIFAVNGELIAGSTHKEVVRRIKSNPLRCELLVISEEGARFYAEHGISVDHLLPNIIQQSEVDSDKEDCAAIQDGSIAILTPAFEIRAPAGGLRRLFFNSASNQRIVEDVNGDEDSCHEVFISSSRMEQPLINHDAMNTELERYAANEGFQGKGVFVDHNVLADELNETADQTYVSAMDTTMAGSYSIANKINAIGIRGEESNTHYHNYETNFHEQGEEQQEDPSTSPIPFSSSSSSLSATFLDNNNSNFHWSNINTATSKFLSNGLAAPRTQVAHPPPTVAATTFAGMMSTLRPRLCRLTKHSPADEFGFNLHAERGKGHFIGAVDKNGIADRAGLETGQRIVGVNGQLIFPNTAHKEVVALIKRNPLSTELLVASEEVDRWYTENNVSFSYNNVIIFEPLPPSSSSSASPAVGSGFHNHHHHHHHYTSSTNHQRNGSYEGASGRSIRSRVGSLSSAKNESGAERTRNNGYQNIHTNVPQLPVDSVGRPQQLVTTTYTNDNGKSTNNEKRDNDSSRSFPIITVDANNATSIRLDSVDIYEDNEIDARTNDNAELACLGDASSLGPVPDPTHKAATDTAVLDGRIIVQAETINAMKEEPASPCVTSRAEETDLLPSQLQLEHRPLGGEAIEEDRRKDDVESGNVDDGLENGDTTSGIRETEIFTSSSVVGQRKGEDVPSFPPSANNDRIVKHVIASGGAVVNNSNQAVINSRPGSFDNGRSGVTPLSTKPVPLIVPPPLKGNDPSSTSVFKDENLNNVGHVSNGSNGYGMEKNGGGYCVGDGSTLPVIRTNVGGEGLKPSDIFKLNAKEARQAMRHRKRDPRQSNNMSLEEKYKVIANL